MSTQDHDYPRELGEQLNDWDQETIEAVENLCRALGCGEVTEEDVVDVLYAADNLKGAALDVAEYAAVDLD